MVQACTVGHLVHRHFFQAIARLDRIGRIQRHDKRARSVGQL